jgi:hypothetical protein
MDPGIPLGVGVSPIEMSLSSYGHILKINYDLIKTKCHSASTL